MDSNFRHKVLIVDDEKTNIIALAQILKPNYDVMVAVDGLTAIETAVKHLPDIILLDIIMPGLSGFDILPQIKENEATKDIPVIFITGLNRVEDEERGLLLGAVDYIIKPFHKSIVKARVRTHLQMAGYIRTIERLCMLDALTGLPNRRGFDSRASSDWARASREQTPLSILMSDIDDFKLYNDTYGHTQGDVLLQNLASVYRHTLNRASDFTARWGGEEFITLLPNTDLTGALRVAEQLRKNVENMLVLNADGSNTSTTICVGVSTITPGTDDSIAQLILSADEGLYLAKKSGKNRVCTK